MRLQRLTALEHTKIHDELMELVDSIREYISLLESRPKLLQLMKDELIGMKETSFVPRKTAISQQLLDMSDLDLILM